MTTVEAALHLGTGKRRAGLVPTTVARDKLGSKIDYAMSA